MHKLDRNRATIPSCLNQWDHHQHTWDDIPACCKLEIRSSFSIMQGDQDGLMVRCAYCESLIRDRGHIEHFRRKNQNYFPELTFSWNNLFLSCDGFDRTSDRNYCGHYKDADDSRVKSRSGRKHATR